jgi:phenylacetate-CoA ligase
LYDPAVQSMRADRLAAQREERLAALRAAVRAAPSSAHGNARGPLRAADFAAEVEAHPPFGRFQLRAAPFIRAGLAIAGLPRPTPTAWTRADLDAEAQLGARALRRAGLAARARSSDCLEGGLITPGTLAISDALDALDALALPVGPVTSAAALQRAAEVWEIVGPEMLIADAASLDFLYAAAAYPRPRGFVALLTPAEAGALAAPARADVYRIFSVPQVCTFAAGECAAHDGFHLAEDALLAEITDERDAPQPDGAPGHLLLTTLERSLTLLRFDTGLRAALDRSPCACGETHARVRFC